MSQKNSPDSEGRASRLFIHSIEKCFQLLEALQDAGRPLGLTELTEVSGLNRSVVQRISHTLKTLGYLKQNRQTRAYTLSGRMLRFSQRVLELDRLRERAHPYLEALNQHTGETVNLMRMEDQEIIYISRFPSRHAVSVDLRVGSRLPVFCTAAGRAILSRMKEEDAREILDASERTPMTDLTLTDVPGLMKTLVDARRLGYALNDQEAFIGDISIAAPLLDRQGRPIAAVNIAVPSPRWRLDDAKRVLAPQVVATARKIDLSLGDL